MEEYISLMSNVGFPIAMCFYFVTRFEKILKENTKAIYALIKKVK